MKRLMKKAAVKQVFTFLMIAILIGLIFLFGINASKKTMEDVCNADKAIFKDDIVEFANKYNTYGSRHVEKLSLPCEYDGIIFVDAKTINQGASINTGYSLIDQSVLNKAQHNIFLVKNGEAEPAGFSIKIVVDSPNYIEFEAVQGKATVVFEGKGSDTKIVSS